jgi:hypothetical protein
MAETRVIRYRTKPECADDNVRLIEDVFAELAALGTTGIRYTALRLDDGVTFVHVAVIEDGDNPLQSSPAFGAFQAGLGARLEEGPFPATATVVGTHGGAIGG